MRERTYYSLYDLYVSPILKMGTKTITWHYMTKPIAVLSTVKYTITK